MELSKELYNKIAKALENDPAQVYWDYRDELSEEQVATIIEDENGLFDVQNEMSDYNMDYMYRLEVEKFEYIIKDFQDEIIEEMIEAGEIEADADEYEQEEHFEDYLDSFFDDFRDYIYCDINIMELVRRTSAKLVLKMGIDHPYEGWNMRGELEYDEVEPVLELFNINPRTVADRLNLEAAANWPDLPQRDGQEKVDLDALLEEWENNIGYSDYVCLLALDLEDYINNREAYQNGIIIHKGSTLGLHCYSVGAGSLLNVPVKEDIVLMKADYDYQIVADKSGGLGNYGIDQVHGLCSSAWGSEISAVPPIKAKKEEQGVM